MSKNIIKDLRICLILRRATKGDTEDLVDMFPDCFAANDHDRAMTPVLFPQVNSNVWVIA